MNRIEVINNNKDLYAEDILTQKIIFYISLFSEEVKVSLQKLKKQGLIQEFKQHDKNKGADIDEFLIKLDEVDIEFIYTIIDILDYYELFKLSLMLCNRYGLSDRIGRYILQISLKYTNLNLFRYDLEKGNQMSM